MRWLLILGLVIAAFAFTRANVLEYERYDPFGDLVDRLAANVKSILDDDQPPTNVSHICVNASKQYLDNLKKGELWALKSKYRVELVPLVKQ